MPIRLLAACLLAALAATNGYTDESSVAHRTPTSELGFIEIQRDYIIRFSDDFDFAKARSPGDAPEVEIFRVLKFGGGSWVLLEYPASPDDVSYWNLQRRAMAQLTEQRVAQLEADPAGAETLQELRNAASRELRTASCWVNLAYAVIIGDVPTDPAESTYKFSGTLEPPVEE